MPLPPVSYTCCQSEGTCALASAPQCPQATPGSLTCAEDKDCWPLSGITIDLEAQSLQWNVERAELSAGPGTLPPALLVVARSGDVRASALTRDDGSFSIALPAAGPATVTAFALTGARSPTVRLEPRSN